MFETEDPTQMRERIRQAAHTGCRMDGAPAEPWHVMTPSVLARQVRDLQRYQNLSDLDAMTVLAFRALKMAEDYGDRCLEAAMMEPAPKLIFIEPAQKA